MKAKSLVLALASCLFSLNLCALTPACGGARIDLIVDHGVDKEAETQARAAVKGVIDFFYNTYGLALERDITIKLTCDKLNYKQAIKQMHGVSEAEALRRSESSIGLQRQGTIIVDLGDIRSNYMQLFVLCHEIVHHFQGQEARDKQGSIRWMSEGVADAIAAHILETVGVQGASGQKNRWTELIKKAPGWPGLDKLHSYNDWLAAVNAYGPSVTYKTSALAVLTLVQWRGYKPLFTYFSALKQTNPEEAFYQAFGSRIGDFEKQFRPF